MFIVDRGVDNGANPNENDGTMYEMSAAHASFGRGRANARSSTLAATGRPCDESVVALKVRFLGANSPSRCMIRATVFTQHDTPPDCNAACTRGLP